MSIESMLRHTLVIERAGLGAANDRGVPTRTYGPLATVKGLIQPKRAREIAAATQAGQMVSDHTVFLTPTDVKGGDRIRFEPTDGRVFQVDGIRDAAGIGHHLELDAHLVQVQA